MENLEKSHKQAVKELKNIEKQLTDIVMNSDNSELMCTFIEWVAQRNVCNELYLKQVDAMVKRSQNNMRYLITTSEKEPLLTK